MQQWLDNIRRRLSWLANVSFDLLFPPHCLFCHSQLGVADPQLQLCAKCLELAAPVEWCGCRRCGARVLPYSIASDCLTCRGLRLRFDSVIVLGSYHQGLQDAILRMKWPHHEALANAMGHLLFLRRREALLAQKADLILPIPMFWWRRLRRGMNSPEVLARSLAKRMHIPMRTDVLVWRRKTLRQAGLSATKRFENVKDALGVRSPEAVHNARILLVDDVLTTGATCSEAAKALKLAGAASVAVAVVARTEGFR